MTSGFYRVPVTIPMDSGLPGDVSTNVWSFRNVTEPVDREADGVSIRDALTEFYSTISNRFSSRVNLGGNTVKVFDLNDDQPRIPFYESTLTLSSEITSNMDFPPEVAICLSFKGAAESGVNAARRRGRVYLGPWQSSSTTDYADVLTADITLIKDGVVAMLAELSSTDIEWCVYSPYTHHGVPVGGDIGEMIDPETPLYPEVLANLYASFTPCATYWVDNSWDTQRRRGTKATFRSTGIV